MPVAPRAAAPAILLLCALLPAAAQPVTTCGNGKRWADRTVCASAPLAALDRQMAAIYARLLEGLSGQGRATLREEQRRWNAQRDSCRTAVNPPACLEERYTHQIAALQSRPARGEELRDGMGRPPAQAADPARRGWTGDLDQYRRAIAACREEAQVPLGKVLAAGPGTDPDTVTLRVMDWERHEYLCTAHAAGHKVFAFAPHDGGTNLPPAGPVYHLGVRQPAGCPHATQVLDVNGKAAGWISDADC